MSGNIQVYRFLQSFLPDSGSRKLVILTGARQTGKTTLSKLKYPKLRYINLDAPENRESLRSVSSIFWGRDIGNAILDEAQKEPVIFEKIKYAYDEGALFFSLILGSSQILLLKKIRESLAGRVSIYEMYPLLMSEARQPFLPEEKIPFPLVDRLFSKDSFAKIFDPMPGILTDKEEALSIEAEKYILDWGGMPALLPLDDEERWKWLRDYEYTYLERDLGDLARLDDLEPFRKFQKLSALRSGQLLNYSELARDATVSAETAKRYLEYLKISYQVQLLQPYHRNLTSTVVKTPKLYWLDIGLLRQLAGYRGEFHGQIYETMVVSEFVKWMRTAQKDGELYFYRTRSGLEVDLLLQTGEGIVGVEIKSRDTIDRNDLKALLEVQKALGKDWRGGLLIYRGNKLEKIAEPDIWAVPSRRLFS